MSILSLVPWLGLLAAIVAAIISQSFPDSQFKATAIITLIATSTAALWGIFITFQSELKNYYDGIKSDNSDIKSNIADIPAKTAAAVGLEPQISNVRQFRDWLKFKDIYDYSDLSNLDLLIVKYANECPDEVGAVKKTKIDIPLNFIDAVSNEEDIWALARLMCCHIVQKSGDVREDFSFTRIATPFTGNTTFASQVAINLGKPLILVNPYGQVFKRDHLIGTFSENEKVLFVHDVIYTGARIRDCVEIMRQHRLIVDHVVVLVERTDRPPYARDTLQKVKINLTSLKRLNAEQIRSMRAASLESQG